MIGKKLPDVTFKTRLRDDSLGGPNPYRWAETTTADIFAGKRVVLFSLPGAFTPTCSTYQLPEFEKLYGDFAAQGIDEITCISVNDAFVMNAWGEDQGAGEEVLMLADGSAKLAAALGVELDLGERGLGVRSRRYSMIVEDGVVKTLNLEAAGGYEVSGAETLLGQL